MEGTTPTAPYQSMAALYKPKDDFGELKRSNIEQLYSQFKTDQDGK